MSQNDKLKNNICFGIGDLIVNKETNNIGILMEKHRLIKSSVDARVDKSTWEWAWSIKWSKNPKNSKNISKSWIKFYACSENAILEEIKGGSLEHYSVNKR
tara:strand:- start:3431 stop:3733 length:303 start_codon:yes stop_codon:yes gene_type:complete